jgi:hypothetical protein
MLDGLYICQATKAAVRRNCAQESEDGRKSGDCCGSAGNYVIYLPILYVVQTALLTVADPDPIKLFYISVWNNYPRPVYVLRQVCYRMH